MRTSKFDFRWISVLAAVLSLSSIIPDGRLMADSPKFSISNDFAREETLLPGIESIIDTYNQDYRLSWSETYSSRLSFDVDFELEMEDIIRSL
ncbi:MAG: hypothetical protein P1S59_14640, partial [bacterium]|nr:hypothetical protein [bacterium]